MQHKPIEPFISIDLETTGLDNDRALILEIAATLYTPETYPDKMKTVHYYVKHMINGAHAWNYAEPYAIQMNTESGVIEKCNEEGVSIDFALEQLTTIVETWKKELGDKRIPISAKNLATADLPWLKSALRRNDEHNKRNYYNRFLNAIHYKTIDVGSMYLPLFGRNPSLYDINKLTGRNEVTHKAVDDARDVIEAVLDYDRLAKIFYHPEKTLCFNCGRETIQEGCCLPF